MSEKQSDNFKEAVRKEREDDVRKRNSVLKYVQESRQDKEKNEFLYRIGQEVKQSTIQEQKFKEYW